MVATACFATASPALAGGSQCGQRVIAANIKNAVLALKATQYCRDEKIPYTVEEVNARLDALNCGPQSIELIDELINEYDRQYKTILTSDVKRVVCTQALTISWD
jgi:hypothetical protein